MPYSREFIMIWIRTRDKNVESPLKVISVLNLLTTLGGNGLSNFSGVFLSG